MRTLGCLKISESNYPVTWHHNPEKTKFSATLLWKPRNSQCIHVSKQFTKSMSWILYYHMSLLCFKKDRSSCKCKLLWKCQERVHTRQHVLYTGCPRRNVPDFGRVSLKSNYTDINQNTYIQRWTVTEIMAREVWNFDSCYTLIDYQIHIKTGRNMLFL